MGATHHCNPLVVRNEEHTEESKCCANKPVSINFPHEEVGTEETDADAQRETARDGDENHACEAAEVECAKEEARDE